MTAPEDELIRVMESYANDIKARPGVGELIAARYRRRRPLRLTALAGGIVVVMVIAAVSFASLRSAPRSTAGASASPSASPSPSAVCSSGSRFCGKTVLPSVPPFTAGRWVAPQNPLPSAKATWPLATFSLPTDGPGGAKVSPMATIDAGHILVAAMPRFESTGGLYSYDVSSGTFHTIVSRMPGGKSILTNRWAVSQHFVVWAIDGTTKSNVFKNGFDVYMAPLSGGAAQFVAHVDESSPETSPWYATDAAVYWSNNSARGVLEQPLAGGTPQPVPGFADMRVVDASGWAVSETGSRGSVTTALKQLGTGRTLDVETSPAMISLSCTPTFCVGAYGEVANGMITEMSGSFIQDLNGGNRILLPEPFARGESSVYATGNGGLVYATNIGSVPAPAIAVWDPLTGAAGALVAKEDASHASSGSHANDVFGFGDGTTTTSVWTYLALGAIN